MKPDISEIERIIQTALVEDLGAGDITSNITIPQNYKAEFLYCSKEQMVVCGTEIVEMVFKKVADIGVVTTEIKIPDGNIAKTGGILISGSGNARAIMAGERVALNLLRQMCGVATITRQYADEIKEECAKLLDTRKTIPGIRALQKYAVTIGGGYNHRIGLYDAVLIKDNHIAICGGVEQALKVAINNAPKGMKIQIECDTLAQLKDAIEFGANSVLLDNMTIDQLTQAVKINAGRVPLEASGGVNIKTIKNIAQTGVDFISVGAITNNPAEVDIGLDILSYRI